MIPGISKLIEEVTEPGHTLYHPVQALLWGGYSYIGTRCFQNLAPQNGAMFAITAYTISQVLAPRIGKYFSQFRGVTLVPFGGQGFKLYVTTEMAGRICQVFGNTITWKQIGGQVLFVFSGTMASKFTLLELRKALLSENKPASG